MTNTVTVPTRPTVDRTTMRLKPVFGATLLLPDLAWCIQCAAFMETWPGIPAGIVYRCTSEVGRRDHFMDALEADFAAKAFYLASPARQPKLPRRASASQWRGLFFGFIARVELNTNLGASPLVTRMHRYA